MSTLTVFYVKLLLIAFSSIAVWLGARSNAFWAQIHQNKQENRVLGIGIILFRLLPFILIYLFMDQSPRGDVPFFWGKATVAYKGGLVYRDFASYHAPLFSYIITLPILLWYTPKAIVLLMVLIEAAIIWGTYRTYKSLHTNVLKSVSLYIILSAPMVMVLFGGQEDIWLWGVAVWMLYYFLRTNDDGLGLGLRFSSGLILIKATAGFWLFPLWFLIKKQWSFLLGMIIVGVPSLIILYLLMGMDFLMPLQMTTNLLTPNLFTIARPLITTILGHAPDLPTFSWIGMVITLASAVWIMYPARHKSLTKTLPLAFLATYIAMTIFQPTSPGYYVFTYMLPLVMELVDWKKNRDIFILLIFNALLVVQPFLFTRLESPTYDDVSVLAKPLFLLEYTLQVLNVVCYGWYFMKVYQKARYS
ncbi:glycosyltransferase family 87 protein [Runella sp.]|uniref:glycosyltransferase family 87 protein n=1 Tax=Runella sp. TaxID=1960881 RepID=UPI003D0FAE21